MIFFAGSSIFQILPATFYSTSIKEGDIVAAKKWLELLKKHDLMDCVKNQSLKLSAFENEEKHWYYLGPTL